jgi:hypothetical protein
MDKVRKPNISVCYTEPCSINMKIIDHNTIKKRTKNKTHT